MSNNINHKDSSYLGENNEKELSVEKAIRKFINPGDRIFIDSGCSEPIELTQKLIDLGPELPDIQILHFLSLSDVDYYRTASGIEDLFRHNAFFIGRSLRDAVEKGLADYTPMLLSEIPKFFKSGQMHLDTALIQVSPPDKWGYCNYGVDVDIVKAIAESADYIIAEINPKMPRVHGNAHIHMDDIDGYVITNHDILEFEYEKPDEKDQKIAKYVASLIEDESTIQMGIGNIPNAVTAALENKKDLGIHSEVFSD